MVLTDRALLHAQHRRCAPDPSREARREAVRSCESRAPTTLARHRGSFIRGETEGVYNAVTINTGSHNSMDFQIHPDLLTLVAQHKKEQRILRLNEGRQIKMDSMSPQERAREKMILALTWIYRFGKASPYMLERVVDTKKSGYSLKLESAGLIKRTKTNASGLNGVPVYFCTLTQQGVAIAENQVTVTVPYDTDPSRVRQDLLRHDELVQRLTLERLKSKRTVGYTTELEMKDPSQRYQKQPDVVWTLPNGEEVGVEVELTAKWGRKFDEFQRGIWLDVLPDEDNRSRYSQCIIYTPSRVIHERYLEAFSEGCFPAPYAKDDRQHWRKVRDTDQGRGDRGVGHICPEYMNRVRVIHIDEK